MLTRGRSADRLLLARHALRTRLAALEGWAQLLRRERRRRRPNEPRLRQLEDRLDAGLLELETDIDRQTRDLADS
jgi:hypothetical protein